MVSYRTTSEDLVQLLLNCYNSKESPKHFTLHEVCKNPYSDSPINPEQYPLTIQGDWPKNKKNEYSFVLRRNLNYALSLKSRVSIKIVLLVPLLHKYKINTLTYMKISVSI